MHANQAQSSPASAAAAGGRKAFAAAKGLDMATLTLDENGTVRDCNQAGETLFKYHRHELIRQHVSKLLPELAELALVENGQPNPRLRFLCRVGFHFRAVAQDGESFASELFLNLLDHAGHARLSLIVRPANNPAI
jgi:PAS domain S-box-containing protein